jgi:hypothetical protein
MSGRLLPAHIMKLLEANRAVLVRRLQGIQYHQSLHCQERRTVAEAEEAARRAADCPGERPGAGLQPVLRRGRA